ncbi:TRAP transporter large permease [Consotaella salsifontis]|uniref:TRAP transporter large permease protein n=1 Tax=Consotaella salsifontis TaxID=1365950 RepID=A0A1T4MTQ1_9HYPH|nr:TRAP transporter large permease subunit [Consotaella salsifontis]SJZ70214.1 C4-dicarboxylate transporter, DctM subunit [Consotaella salsifontis]
MEPLILLGLVLGLMFLGVPIAVALGLSSTLIIAYFSNDSVSSVAQQLFTASQNYTLLAIPYFILASSFMSTGGVARRIIRFAVAVVGHIRGGLAIAAVLACMLFAALSGSSPATVVAIGTLAISGMVQVGYSKSFAAGIIANAGTLGILIPPSIVMVVYAASVNVSVGRMFMAGVVPGLLAGAMLMGLIYIVARMKGLPAEPRKSVRQIIDAGKEAGFGLFLIVIILGGIYGGVFTPTEAAAVAAVYSFWTALFVYRDMGPMKGVSWFEPADPEEGRIGFSGAIYGTSLIITWFAVFFLLAPSVMAPWLTIVSGLALGLAGALYYVRLRGGEIGANAGSCFAGGAAIFARAVRLSLRHTLGTLFHEDTRKVLVDSAKVTVMLMFIIVNALLFAHVLTAERVPQIITDWMIGIGFNWFTFLIAVNVLLLIGGQFMEPSGLLLIVAPVVFPIAIQLGVDPIHLGIIMVVNMEIGMITPPIGLNLFVTSGITGMSLVQVVKAAMPFVAVLFLFLIMVTYIPALSTALPNAMFGPEIVQR